MSACSVHHHGAVVTDPPHGTDAWHAARRKRIGASDVPAILGLSPYSGPYSVWSRKTGRVPPTPATRAMRLGSAMEGIILGELALELQARDDVQVVGCQLATAYDRWPTLVATPDGHVLRGDEHAALVEIKRAHPATLAHWRAAAEGRELVGAPRGYYAQVQAQLLALGQDRAILAALLGNELVQVAITRNDDFALNMLASLAVFWKLVEEDTPPRPTAADAGMVADAHADDGPAVVADDLAGDFAELEATKAEIKRLTTKRRELEAVLRAAAGDASEIVARDWRATWKRVETRRLDAKRLRAERPEIAREYEIASTSSRLVVRRG